ncbi:MAG: two-component regulator propeller domain-containing protein [Paludibacter sp.]
MFKRKIIIGFLLCVFSLSGWTQVEMGKWRTHFAYDSITQIAQSENKIFAISKGSLFSVDKLDRNMEFYSKLSGLYGNNISSIEYDSSNHQLLIIYSNGNIDVLAEGGVSNVPDLYNKQMSADKDVNHVTFYQDRAYLSCNFGILVLNMQKKEVADTYYIGPNATEVKVLNTAILKGNIYALTSSTLFKASIDEKHLVNYAYWSPVTGLPGNGNLQYAVSFAGQLFLLRNDKLYKLDSNNSWSAFLPSKTISSLNVTNVSLNLFSSNEINLVDTLLQVKTINNLGTITDAEYDNQNKTYWFAAGKSGIKTYKQEGSDIATIDSIKPAGPAMNSPFSMKFSGNKLFVVPGGGRGIFYNNPGIIMIYENNSWSNISNTSIEDKTGIICRDFVSISIDPTDNSHFFASSYSSGLYEFKKNEFYKYYNFTNSTIENLFGSYQYQMLGGSAIDNEGNLWVLNDFVSNGVKIMLADGTWKQLTYPGASLTPTFGEMIISNQNVNQKWLISVRVPAGVCVFDDNGTITDQSDDHSVFISQFTYPETDNNGNTVLTSIAPTYVYSIAQDQNGTVWVGTDQGPFLFNNLSKVFDSGYTCSRVKIPRGDGSGLADYLLVNEKIKAIVIDGANRKWIGTESSGVYLMSENGQSTIQHFTTANSPLLSNDILSIAINPVTGEVFFGTGLGIVSYQSDASLAGDTFNNVHAYPNPVREGFTGVITITGLVQDTQVKITDLNGNLVCQTVSNGSLATWDGKDLNGRKVNTGIYLALCANSDGTQSAITKILVIN